MLTLVYTISYLTANQHKVIKAAERRPLGQKKVDAQVLTLLEGFIATEITGSGMCMDSCKW